MASSQHHSQKNYDGEDYKIVKLPRVEVQLLCQHDIRPDFDVRETFHHFYQEFFFPALSHNDDDTEHVVNDSPQYSIQNNKHGGDGNAFDTELYTFVSLSDVSDVKHSEEYYETCDQESSTVLATMDVRGYIHVKTSTIQNHDRALLSWHGLSSYMHRARSSSSSSVHPSNHDDEDAANDRTEQNLETLINKVQPSAIKDFFAQHVCSSPSDQTWVNDSSKDVSDSNDTYFEAMEYFKAKVRPWNIKLAPPPPSSSVDYPYPSTKDRLHFEHNLRLLCEGGVDVVYPNYHKEVYQGPESIFSLVFGLIVGAVMFVMIYKEMQQKHHSWDRRRRERRLQRDEMASALGVGTTSGRAIEATPLSPEEEGYASSPRREIEIV
jgi:hypothetical protein